jgi:hypothetical protein
MIENLKLNFKSRDYTLILLQIRSSATDKIKILLMYQCPKGNPIAFLPHLCS